MNKLADNNFEFIQDNQTPVLLLVDDEPNVLSSLNRMLHDECFIIKQATSAQDGLKILNSSNVQVIISDHNMPGMTGVEFLSKVKELYPNTIRILLTAETDIKLLSDAVNKGEIYKFIVKPWDIQLLKANISEAFNQYSLNKEKHKLEGEIKQANEELSNINSVLQQEVNQKSEELIKISQYDSLTSLPNRMLFLDRLSQQIINTHDSKDQLYITVIGIDKISIINDNYGHVAGDLAIKTIANNISSSIGESGTVARISGDEFSIIFNNDTSENTVVDSLQSLFDTLSTPIHINSDDVYITVSAGLCVYPTDAQSSEAIIKNASAAMHHSKNVPGNSYNFYSSDMQLRSSKRLILENKLRTALDNNEYVLHYQPQLEISTGLFKGVEALLRWSPSGDSIIAPDVFIPILEETGMIVEVGEWVLKNAMLQAIDWHGKGVNVPLVSVNLSPRQFKMDNLVGVIEKHITDTGFNAIDCKLEIEITESLLVEDISTAVELLNQISALDVRIAMDDFGTGYASLNYITQFPVNTLKIDRSFIGRVDNSIEDQAIVRAIITMAHSLNMSVVAEGVETHEQLDYLRSLNCDVIQGYLFNRPVSAQSVITIYNDMINENKQN